MTASSIDRYFETSLYVLIVTGFATLASTGKLDAPALLFVSAALLFRGYLLLRRRTLQLPERWTSYLTLVYVVFYICDLFFLSGNFVSATVHLVLFAMVVKIFSVQRDRDHLYLAIISFLSVLAAAVLTVDAVFFAGFCIFLLAAASTFISMEMRRSAVRAAGHPRTPNPSPRKFSISLSTTAVALALAIAVGAGGIFFVLPRLSAGYLSAYAARNTLASGFSDEVRLGEIGRIQQSDSVVMHIQIDGDTRGVHDLKWRGVALRNFDGSRWSNPGQHATALNSTDGNFELSSTRASLAAAPPRLVRYRVLMEPIGSTIFFVAPSARTLSGPYRSIAVDEGGAVLNTDSGHAIGTYYAVSNVGQASPEELRTGGGEIPAQIAMHYLQLPRVDPHVTALARDVTATAPTAYDKAVAVERYLQAHYAYTLQLPSTAPADPIANFLFERKAGHCEFFASSMAVMLRTLGIPARVVNGFRGGEFNPVSGSYILRARDAHSWAEAYFPPYGWQTFDPTPAAAVNTPSVWTQAGLYMDAMQEFWREWVINYDFAHQMNLSNSLTVRNRRIFEASRRWMRHAYGMLVERAQRAHGKLEKSPQKYGIAAIGIVVLVFLLLNLAQLKQAWRTLRVARNPGRAPQAAASVWYARMLRAVSRRGWRKQPVHTPREFLLTIEDPKLRGSVAAFTDHYERARFGNSAQDAEVLPHIYEEIRKR